MPNVFSDNLQIKARRAPSFLFDGVEIFLFERHRDGCIKALSGIQFTTYDLKAEPFSWPHDDGLNFTMTQAQKLMDELWACGLRPTEGTGSAGALAATQQHLKDMQDFSRRLLTMVQNQSRAADLDR